MILNSIEQYNLLKADTVFTFVCTSCGGTFEKRKRRGKRGETFNFLCQSCGRKMTNIKRYGTENVFASDTIKSKIKETCLEKYGVENPMFSEQIKDRSKETCLKKYNVAYSFQSDNNKEKSKETLLEKYGVDHPSKSKEIKKKMVESWLKTKEETQEKIEKTCLEKYGVARPMQNYNVQLKAKKKYTYDNLQFDSSWELALYIYCIDNNIDFEYHPNISFKYKYNDIDYSYFPDFKIENDFVEIKGLQFFENKDVNGKMINPFDRSLDDKFEAKHQCMLEHNVKIITDCSKYVDYVNKKYTSDFLGLFENGLDFPYLNQDLSDKSDMGLIHHFHKSIYAATRKGKVSPIVAWQDKNIIKKIAFNRLKYVGHCRPSDILQGFNVTRVANKVSLFSPKLAENLIKKYIPNADIIIDPFSGFSGRMLGSYNCDIHYIGWDINEDHVRESNEIVDYKLIGDMCDIKVQDLITFEGKDWSVLRDVCLFTCPPYGGKEHWNKNNDEIEKSCDEWIDLCLEKHRGCIKYLFVVDETEKYKDKIVETITNKSHFGSNNEYVIVI